MMEGEHLNKNGENFDILIKVELESEDENNNDETMDSRELLHTEEKQHRIEKNFRMKQPDLIKFQKSHSVQSVGYRFLGRALFRPFFGKDGMKNIV